METLTYEQRREIEQAEQAKRNQAFEKLIAAIAKQMPGWVNRPDGDDSPSYRRYVLVKDGMSIHFSRDSQKKDRMNISTWGWPKYTKWERGEMSESTITPNNLYNPKETSPSISVAIDRGAEAIVREINRRFLPDYERIYSRCLDQAISYGTHELQTREMWTEACKVAGVENRGHASAYVKTKRGQVNMEQRSSSVHLTFDADIPTLKRILDALNSTDEA